LVELVKQRIPAKFKVDAIRDIQVLCPMNRGSLGIRELNVRLQHELNPPRADEPGVDARRQAELRSARRAQNAHARSKRFLLPADFGGQHSLK